MFGKTVIEQAIKTDVSLSSAMTQALQLWTNIYSDTPPWAVSNIIPLQGLAAAISAEIARAVTLELETDITGSARAEYLQNQFARVLHLLRNNLEFGCAKGGLVFKPYISNASIFVDYVQADQFYPIEFDGDGTITSAIFVDIRQIGKKHYTRLEMHSMDMSVSSCRITNTCYVSDNPHTLGHRTELSHVSDWTDIEPEVEVTGIDKPLFAYFRYPMANHIDSSSPLGVSCFSRATDLIRRADEIWSTFLWELDSGQRALYVDSLAFTNKSDGTVKLPTQRLYRVLDMGGAKDELFHDWSPNIRQKDILASLDAVLKRIEYTCGLAYGTLSNPTVIEKTATEIKMSKQRTYATIVDTQKELERALTHLLYAMDVWTTIGNLAPKGIYEAAFQFDDSIVTDTETQFQQDLYLVAQGLMSRVEFRMRNFRESERMAEEALKKIDKEKSEYMEDYVDQLLLSGKSPAQRDTI